MQLAIEQAMTATPEALFAMLSDPSQRPRWQRSLSWVQLQTPGSPGLGTRWRERTVFGAEFSMRTVRHEPSRAWAEHGEGRGFEVELWVQLAAEAQGTRLSLSASFSAGTLVSGLLTVGKPLMVLALRSDLRALDRLAV